jgi:hypothetical protein
LKDPEGAEAAWWIPADDARAVIKLARRNGGDIVAATKVLGVQVTEHSAVLARASAAVGKIGVAVAKAQQHGDMKFFNAEFKKRRLAAAAKGRPFMSFRQAQSKLQRALSDTIAARVTTGEVPAASIVTRVFDGG